jgi:hypothetical protein
VSANAFGRDEYLTATLEQQGRGNCALFRLRKFCVYTYLNNGKKDKTLFPLAYDT